MFTNLRASSGSSRLIVTFTTLRSWSALGSRLTSWFLPTTEPIRVTLPVTACSEHLDRRGVADLEPGDVGLVDLGGRRP